MANNIPVYRAVYETLRKHILEEVYNEGDLLPSENEICRLYNTTRPTVRKALDTLVHEGYIKKQQGKGSIVIGTPKSIGIMSLSGITDAVGDKNLRTEIVVKPVVEPWPKDFAYQLSDVVKESGCIYMERLRYVDGVPVFYDITRIPNINISRFSSRSFENKSLFNILRKDYGIEITGGEQNIVAMHADNKIAKCFNLEEGHPILHLDRRLETNNVNIDIFSSLYCDTQKHVLHGVF